MAVEQRQAADAPSTAPSPPTPTTALTRPTTPTSPVQIPVKSRREAAHLQRQHRGHWDKTHQQQGARHRSKNAHNLDAIPPSVAALLAVTSIPPPKASLRSLRSPRSASEKRMTVDSIIERAQEAEKEFSLTLSKSPLDILLAAPEDLEEDGISVSDSVLESALSTRTVSLESMPSLADSFATGTISSVDSPCTPSSRGSGKTRPTRRTPTPVSSPPGEREGHPLSASDIDLDELDFRVFQPSPDAPTEKTAEVRFPFRPLKSAFKSNLTASLRALRNAARSFSSLNLTSIPPDDFLTRSLFAIDPRIPYTDERRPPLLDEEPSAALRRYLNPTSTARIEPWQSAPATPPAPVRPAFTASIQMQTYKVHRPRGAPPSAAPRASTPASSVSSLRPQRDVPLEYPLPGPRQRELRENSDFIRIAVMEMAMRKKGKLDDRKPGRARLALPPRKTSSKPYVIGPDGVPARWVAVSY